jgi:hypothetical protein
MIPETVSLGGISFSVIRKELREDYGQFHFDKREIWISESISDDLAWETLRHEMIHAALYISGHTFAEKYEEEPIVRSLENLFFPAWGKLEARE